MNPEWIELRGKILNALEPFPDAKAAVLDAIAGYAEPNVSQVGLVEVMDEYYSPETPDARLRRYKEYFDNQDAEPEV